jgi:hypothetical protein
MNCKSSNCDYESPALTAELQALSVYLQWLTLNFHRCEFLALPLCRPNRLGRSVKAGRYEAPERMTSMKDWGNRGDVSGVQ